MKQSTIWIVVGGVASLFALMVGGALIFSMVGGLSNGPNVATASVNMEKLTEAFERAFKGDAKKDVKAFEAVVNEPSSGIYKGSEHATVVMEKSGEVVGFVDQDKDGKYDISDDKLFSIQAEKEKEELVATDNHNRHYRHRPASGFFTGYLVGNMLSRQRGHYGGRHWTSSPTSRYVRPGYYGKLKNQPTGRVGSSSASKRSSSWGSSTRRSSSSSSSSSSRSTTRSSSSTRSSSWGSSSKSSTKSSSWGSSSRSGSKGRSRSGSRSGGFGFGK